MSPAAVRRDSQRAAKTLGSLRGLVQDEVLPLDGSKRWDSQGTVRHLLGAKADVTACRLTPMATERRAGTALAPRGSSPRGSTWRVHSERPCGPLLKQLDWERPTSRSSQPSESPAGTRRRYDECAFGVVKYE